jgi:periplasmic divalent cation tolerance protein
LLFHNSGIRLAADSSALFPYRDGIRKSGESVKTKMQYIQVQITFPTLESAEEAAEKIVDRRLAACAQIAGIVRSIYTWKGKREKCNEILLLAKTRAELFGQLVEAVRDGHPYECPQIVAVPLIAGNEDYLAWLDEQTAD